MAHSTGVKFAEALFLWFLPILFDIFPLLSLFCVGTAGEVNYAVLGRGCLVAGWMLHDFERYCYDSFCIPVGGPLAFVTSPTGVFHMLTGVTIVTAILHISTVEAHLESTIAQQQKLKANTGKKVN